MKTVFTAYPQCPWCSALYEEPLFGDDPTGELKCPQCEKQFIYARRVHYTTSRLDADQAEPQDFPTASIEDREIPADHKAHLAGLQQAGRFDAEWSSVIDDMWPELAPLKAAGQCNYCVVGQNGPGPWFLRIYYRKRAGITDIPGAPGGPERGDFDPGGKLYIPTTPPGQ